MAEHRHDHHAGMHGRAWGREEALAALEFPERRATQDPEALWNRIRLAEGATVVEVGAGTGYFVLPAARRVGPKGHVYAVDLSLELVDLVRDRARSEGLAQLEAVRSSETKIPLPPGLADVVLLANVLHDIPPPTLREAVRLLKTEGALVNLDWKKETTERGPPISVRLTPEAAAERLAAEGLEVTERWEFGPHHYGLTCRKRTRG